MQQLAMADDDADPRRKSSLSKFDKVCVFKIVFPECMLQWLGLVSQSHLNFVFTNSGQSAKKKTF